MEEKKEVQKSITETSPVINKIILIENGRGGLKVNYNIGQTINGVMNNKKRQEQVNRPVQKEIRGGFGLLKKHLLRACCYHFATPDIEKMLLAKCVVTTIVIDKKDQIQISGYMLTD